MIEITTKTKTKIKDRGANNLFRQLEMMGKETIITAGIQMPEGGKLPTYKGVTDGKVPIAQYAFWNEYGTKNIPSRPFLRKTVADRKDLFLKQSITNMKRLSRGGNAFAALNKQAMDISKWIKTTIWTLREPPNSPATLRKKRKLGRGSNPLIFSNSMRESITSTVHMSQGPKHRKLRRIVNKINKEVMRMVP